MAIFLLQMTVVLLIALACGAVARRLGQSRVIGEIIGGILLGPSVFGRISPGTFSWLFPASALASFDVLSTVGLILFLFLIGSELNFAHLSRERARATVASSFSILLPFALAAAVAHPIRARFAPLNTGSLPFVLFLGVAMSITAFPVLARILEERGMQTTALGTTALLCAAVDDVVAWTMLATALTLISHRTGTMPLWVRLLWLLLYIVGMIGVVRPVAAWLVRRKTDLALTYELSGVIVAVVLLSAAATEAIGVHPLFGAFLAGVCFPRVTQWQRTIRARLDMLVSVLLLPFFFAITGMRTRFDLLQGRQVWEWTVIILVIAIVGKLGGATLASRWTGESWRNALALGALLNTRGLVELIVLNIAYNAKVFSPTLFTMLVVMALVTTMLTTPLMNWLGVSGETLPSLVDEAVAGSALQ